MNENVYIGQFIGGKESPLELYTIREKVSAIGIFQYVALSLLSLLYVEIKTKTESELFFSGEVDERMIL